jgi:alkylated DNA repair dioxygenase AlkB
MVSITAIKPLFSEASVPSDIGPDLLYIPDFLTPEEATRLYNTLLKEIPWKQFTGNFGKPRPRLESWHGDADAVYGSYNGGMRPQPWTPALLEIRRKVEEFAGLSTNGVLANLYRDERDSVDAHSDDEPEFGENPTIPSLSLNEVRRFILRNIITKEKLVMNPAHGSLIVMRGDCQSAWTHQVPKEKSHRNPRINLTFRRILGRT